jgi:hypothetical protein
LTFRVMKTTVSTSQIQKMNNLNALHPRQTPAPQL